MQIPKYYQTFGQNNFLLHPFCILKLYHSALRTWDSDDVDKSKTNES